MMKALLMVRRGAPLTRALVRTLRGKGVEPFVLSSLPADGGVRFRELCAEIDVRCAVAPGVALTSADVTRALGEIEGCDFCLTQADSQRALMAEANELLGAPDASSAGIRTALDKHLMRTTLGRLGLSKVRSLRLDDPVLRRDIEAGQTFVVKPRRGAGSLCVGVVDRWAQVTELAAAFAAGTVAEDVFAEYFADNELIAESFFAGRELSLETIRQDGRSRLVVDHEKTALEFGAGTVLERGMASPVVSLTEAEMATAGDLVDRVLDGLGLSDGCYHVEVRVNDNGEAEIIEINPRVGGGAIFESVLAQYGRSMTEDWIDVLKRQPVTPLRPRACGTYLESAFPDRQEPIMTIDRNPDMPEPASFEADCAGVRLLPYREFFAASAMWATDLATHREQVAELMSQQYCSFRYLPGLSGRPVLLLLEPDYAVLDAAVAVPDVDVVVCHQDPVAMTPEYVAICDRLAALVRVPSWSATEECLALAREAYAGSPLLDVLAPHEMTREVQSRLMESLSVTA